MRKTHALYLLTYVVLVAALALVSSGCGDDPEAPNETIVSAKFSSISGTDGVINDDAGATVTIELIDVDGEPVSGVVPEFSATGAGNAYHACSESDVQGVSTCTMTSSEAGAKTLRITSPVDVPGNTIQFHMPCDQSGVPFGGGQGDAAAPYLLCAPSHLSALGDDEAYMGRHFIVVKDIDMEGVENFAMIGSGERPFSGFFNGNQRRITNLSIQRETENLVGLFRATAERAHVKNIALEDVDVRGQFAVGALIGKGRGHIENSFATGSVRGTEEVGGLVGITYNQSILDSYANASVVGSRTVGGLVGYSVETTVMNSHASGNVDATESVGGLVGKAVDDSKITNSYASNIVEGESGVGGLVGRAIQSTINDSYVTGSVIGQLQVGGLIGLSDCLIRKRLTPEETTRAPDARLVPDVPGGIINSYAIGGVKGVEDVGGLIGLSLGCPIVDSHATGGVIGDENVGGFVGQNYFGDIVNAHSSGPVNAHELVGGLVGLNLGGTITGSSSSSVTKGQKFVGGLVGQQVLELDRGEIVASFATGDTTGTDYVGGLIGTNFFGAITDSYATGSAKGANAVGGFVGGNAGPIRNSYASGNVQGDTLTRGFIGEAEQGYSTVTASFWDKDTSGMASGGGGAVGLSTSEFSNQTSFPAWDFIDTWVMGTAADGETRPILQGQAE